MNANQKRSIMSFLFPNVALTVSEDSGPGAMDDKDPKKDRSLLPAKIDLFVADADKNSQSPTVPHNR
jgi:hypothetical protein